MNNRKTEEEIPRRDPARCNKVFAEKRNDDGPAAENDGSGQIEGREEGEAAGNDTGEEGAEEDNGKERESKKDQKDGT